MANKLSKRFFGTLGSAATPHIPVRIKPTAIAAQAGYIVKQKAARRFQCTSNSPTSPPSDPAVYTIAEGTNMDPTVDGTMTIIGLFNGSPIALKKLNFRTAVGFNGIRYKWSLEDDSTQTLLILTAI